ncbi:DUF1127 domain-containing protein [Rhizobium sp. ZK1]|uniref:DUF1127 domain-containing protein n=1 Tax=Rhizobium sp. ZK1 TaxID=3389872 RepID=UPI0039F702CA
MDTFSTALEIFENFLEALNYGTRRILQTPVSFEVEGSKPSNLMEVIMSDCCTPACASHRRPSHRHHGPIVLRSVVVRWFWRIHIRRERKQRSKISPALLDDIGLPQQQAGSEATGFFWHV